MAYDQAVAIVMCDVGGRIEKIEAQAQLRSFLTSAHQNERQLKNDLESLRIMKMRRLRDLPINEGFTDEEKKYYKKINAQRKNARRDWLRLEYVPSLRKIGMGKSKLESLMSDARCNFLIDNQCIFERRNRTIPLARIYVGDAAFEVKPVAGDGIVRVIYQKKGFLRTHLEKTVPTEYIKDDFGRMTRRYAYVEKDFKVFKLILDTPEGLFGKSVGSRGSAEGLQGNPFRIGARTSAKWDLGRVEGQIINLLQLAHMNQEEGSTVQRAHPLTSTSRNLHGNEGYRFGQFAGVKLKIDLAKIPVGNRTRKTGTAGVTDQALLNLYSWESQNSSDGFETIGVAVKDKKGEITSYADEAKEHSDNSTSKNRELMLLRFPRNAIAQIFCHRTDLIDKIKTMLESTDLEGIDVLHEAHGGQFKEELY